MHESALTMEYGSHCSNDTIDGTTFAISRRQLRRIFLSCFRAFCLFSLLCLTPAAQAASGASGAVRSAVGAAIPNARITFRETTTSTERTASTDTTGNYSVPDLPTGTYEITVESAGFATEVRTNIGINVDSDAVVNVVMRAGANATSERRLTAVEASGVGGNVNSSTVRDSPLNGRDWTQLAGLEAGVTGVQTGGVAASRGFGAAISVSGARPDQNNYRLDGITINDYSNGAPGSVMGANLGVDAVEQFSVLGSNYPAGYGRTSGGVINAVTRSGTRSFHGTVYEFLRNSVLDARNFFDGGIPPFKRNQFGGSLGGPIAKRRTFFFADYEGLRQSLGVTTVDTVPSASARSGLLSAGTVQTDPTVVRYLNAFYPLPNGGALGNGDVGIFSFAGQQVTSENYFTSKIDHTISGRDSVFGTFLRDNSNVVRPDAMNALLSKVVSSRQLITVHEQHVFSPKLVNAARVGYNRAVAIEGGVSKILNPLMTDPSFGFVPGGFVGSIRGVPGLTDFLGGPNAALPDTLASTKNFFWNSFQWADDLYFTRGSQALQFGMITERMQDNLRLVSNANGGFKFGSLVDLLANRPRNFQGLAQRPIPTIGIRETLLGLHAQDDIKVRPGLNLSLGIRYEMSTVPTEAHGRISNLEHLTDVQPRLGSPFFLNPTLRNFEPRTGLVWSPFANSKTIVRAGFGMFDVLPLPYEFTLTLPYATPYSQQLNLSNPAQGSFPTAAFQQVSGSVTASRAGFTEHAPKRNYVMQWNINLQHEFSPHMTATLGYVGSRGVHQPFRQDDFDMVLPSATPAGYLFPPGATSQKVNPNFGRISGTLWQANSSYHALQAVITKSLSRGVQFHVAYTWSKSIDTLSATVADDSFPNGLMNPLFFDQRMTRGLSDFNAGQNFVANITWEVPAARGKAPFPRWILGGWQLGGIYKASSGQPFTPILGGDPNGMKTEETGEPPSRLVGPGCGTLVNPGDPNHYIKTQCLAFPNPASLRGNLGRNAIVGPGMSNLDFSVFKNNVIRRGSEKLNVQFRAEIFNLFNRANFASPLDNLLVFDQSGRTNASAGLITTTQTPAREIQFALKLIW